MPKYLTDDRTLIERVARKPHRCVVHRRAAVYAASGITCPVADGLIHPGETYVEYVGDVGPYETGSAYHVACCHAEWDAYLTQHDGR